MKEAAPDRFDDLEPDDDYDDLTARLGFAGSTIERFEVSSGALEIVSVGGAGIKIWEDPEGECRWCAFGGKNKSPNGL